MIYSKYLRILLILIATLSTQSSLMSQTANKQDVISYNFDIRVSDDNDSIYVLAEIKSKSEKDLILNLSPNMTISNCSDSTKELKFERNDDLLIVHTNKGLNTIKLQYAGIPSDGLIIGKNKNGKRTFFGDNWPERARNWLSVYDHPSDKATVEFTVHTPKKYQVVANGKLIRIKENGLFHSYHYKTSYPLSTKLMVVGVAEFEKQILQKYPYEISTFSYPEDKMKLFYDYEVAPAICSFFEKTIDKYPFDKLYNVQSTTKYGGMENAGCIFYDENSFDGQRNNEDLLAHEIAHQWFGNSLSEKDWRHVWLSEGFSTFFENYYMLKKYGEEFYNDILDREKKNSFI